MLNKNHLHNILSYVSEQSKAVFGNKLESVILYGSYARGDFDDESDIDIMIIADIVAEDVNSYTLMLRDRIYRFEIDNDCVVSLCVVSKPVFDRYKSVVPFYKNVMKEGKKLAV